MGENQGGRSKSQSSRETGKERFFRLPNGGYVVVALPRVRARDSGAVDDSIDNELTRRNETALAHML